MVLNCIRNIRYNIHHVYISSLITLIIYWQTAVLYHHDLRAYNSVVRQGVVYCIEKKLRKHYAIKQIVPFAIRNYFFPFHTFNIRARHYVFTSSCSSSIGRLVEKLFAPLVSCRHCCRMQISVLLFTYNSYRSYALILISLVRPNSFDSIEASSNRKTEPRE